VVTSVTFVSTITSNIPRFLGLFFRFSPLKSDFIGVRFGGYLGRVTATRASFQKISPLARFRLPRVTSARKCAPGNLFNNPLVVINKLEKIQRVTGHNILLRKNGGEKRSELRGGREELGELLKLDDNYLSRLAAYLLSGVLATQQLGKAPHRYVS